MQTLVRVRSLTYREKCLNTSISFDSPLPAFRVGDFDAAFEKGLWNFTALTDFASVESARATLEPLLQDWETEWDVLEQLRLCFEFKSCVLEAHAKDGTVKLAVTTLSAKELSLGAAYNLRRPAPSPPSGRLHYTPLAKQLCARWHEIEDHKVRLLVGANLILTSLVSEFGGRRRGRARQIAAQKLKVESRILPTAGYASGEEFERPETI